MTILDPGLLKITTIGAKRKSKPRKPRKSREPTMGRAEIVAAIARIIDPEAWAGHETMNWPMIVQKLRQQVSELGEDIERLSIVPTTPEGEHCLLHTEMRMIRRRQPKSVMVTRGTAQARRLSMVKARQIVDLFDAHRSGTRTHDR